MEIDRPKLPIPLEQRLLNTGLCVSLLIVSSRLPVFGITKSLSENPYQLLTNSSHGTLMELGIAPLITTNMAVQVMAGGKILSFKDTKSMKMVQKVGGLFLTLVLATMNVAGGMYGSIGVISSIMVVLQLVSTVLMIMFLDEVLEKGYGVGTSAGSLFAACNVAESLIWHSFSPVTANFRGRVEFEGAIVEAFRGLFHGGFNMRTIRSIFFRSHLPNLWTLLLTIAAIGVILFLQSLSVVIKVINPKGRRMEYPIELFYTATTPVMLLSQFASSLGKTYECMGQILGYNNFVMGALGGMIYNFFHPPASVIQEPLHFLVYSAFTVVSCTLLSKAWIELSGSSSKDVAKQWREEGLTIVGHRSSHLHKELDRYIPAAAALGGFGIGVVSVVASMMGVIGSGTGLFIAAGTISHILRTIQKEKQI
ncbi:hypothetical protein SELMODRAFT_233482 [Selaginella moellendorffii]|uniref:Translocon Sec61/SecY plug domain-containing protein n=2 Tax=Selaginella moellendorffii TaxID=88036 RepID=D8S9P8_SELML|nr:hypothetical protein SELMODRAFT_233482 [Selaginella moellendorffii]